MNWGVSLFVIAVFILFVWSLSQTRFKNKMLCRFRRPNHMLIERWVPLYVKYVVFDEGKYGIGQYVVIGILVLARYAAFLASIKVLYSVVFL